MSMTSSTAANMTEQVVEKLRATILACEIRPGTAVSETQLSETMGYGRAPIRAALARLAEEGLVQAVPRRGWMVTQVTMRDIHEVFDLRLILEPEAASRAAQSHDQPRLAALSQVCDRDYRPEDPGSVWNFLDANRDFHMEVAELSGNRRLARQIGRLLDESRRMLVLGLSRRDRSSEMADEHGALIAALKAGDSTQSAAIMREQVLASCDMVVGALTGPLSDLVVSEAA